MPNILIISAVFPPEPIVSASISKDLAEELSKENQVTVLCPRPTRPYGFNLSTIPSKTDYKIVYVESYTYPKSSLIGRFRESISFGMKCVGFINKNFKNINCIYINAWPIFAPYLMVKAAKRYHIPCIVHVQDVYPEALVNKLPFGRKLVFNMLYPFDEYVMEHSTSIITISKIVKNSISFSRKIRPDKMLVVPNWQDEVKFCCDDSSRKEVEYEKTFVFMYLGNIGPLACIDLLIHSFISAAIPNSKLVIAGAGSKKADLVKLSETLNATNIEFVDVPENQVKNIQALADVMLLSVIKNGAMSSIPSKLPAYMFSAKPIIGSLDLESETAKAILDSKCGNVVAPQNIEALKNEMIAFSDMEKSRLVELGNNGFEYAMEHFSKKKNLPLIAEEICKKANLNNGNIHSTRS